MSADDRRKYTRLDSLNLSYVCVDKDGTLINEGMGRTLNVSEGGILLETHFRTLPDQILHITIAIDDYLFETKGKVIHCHQCSEGVCQTGVQFLKLDDTTRKNLKEFIKLFKEKTQDEKIRIKI